MRTWTVREDDAVDGGLVIEDELDEDIYIMICPEAVPTIASMQSKNVYVDAGDRQYCYLIEFPRLLKNASLLKITKLYYTPGSGRESRFRFSMHYEFEGDDVNRIVEEALRIEDYRDPDEEYAP